MRRTALGAIRLYQRVISSYLPGACRHTPTCSTFTFEAVEKYGAIKGVWMGTKRLSRCRPMGTSGYDPVR